MNRVLCDSCYWFGLLTETDQYHEHSMYLHDMFSKIGNVQYLIHFPSLYETLNTAFCDNPQRMEEFNKIVDKMGVFVLDDNYRDKALETARSKVNYYGRHLSLVDIIIRMIIEDNSVSKDYLVTSNKRDFDDITGIYNVALEEILKNQDYGK